MKKSIFNPKDWLFEEVEETSKRNIKDTPAAGFTKEQNREAVEAALVALEASRVDITSVYPVWVQLGFALSHEFGEGGRDYFHRLSKFYPGYTPAECDLQFSRCLQSKGSGITLATFFYQLQENGISYCIPSPVAEGKQKEVALENRFLKLPEGEEDFSFSASQQDLEGVLRPETLAAEQRRFTEFDPEGNAFLEEEEGEEKEPLPTFPEEMFSRLPEFLQRVVAVTEIPEERDMLLLGSITVLSSCFPKVTGYYDEMEVYSNLFLYVTAPPSAGKGRLVLCKRLVMPVHEKFREEGKLLKMQYANELAAYNMGEGGQREKPAKPPERMLVIPGNNSSTGMSQLLNDNDGKGLLIETEGDTMAQAFKSDYGNYSDVFRKAFHHEGISYYRRTDRESVEIQKPRLSAVLSGTPKQIPALIPTVENGLFSRFIFYYLNLRPTWRKVFRRKKGPGLQERFDSLGLEFFELYKALEAGGNIEVVLSQAQSDRFDEYFERVQARYLQLLQEDFVASVRRLGLIAFRIMMVLTGLRIMEDGDASSTREVAQEDFETALAMVAVLVRHSSRVFSFLPHEKGIRHVPNNAADFYERLPETFNRQDYLELATKMKLTPNMADKVVRKLLKEGLLIKVAYNCYRKVE